MSDNSHHAKNSDKELELARLEIEKLKEKLKQQNQLITNFFSNLSYEIRTPLNGILGFSELLNTSEILCEDAKMYANVINESSLLLLSILNDAMDISRIEVDRYKVYPEAFDLNDLLFEIFMEYKSQAEQKKLQLFLDNMISEQFIIESAPNTLKKILTKLLDNAIKFTKEGWIKMGYTDEGEYLVFSVEDTGIGIPEVIRKNLFHSFISQEVSTSRKVSGSGLDLTLCNGLVKLLGGEIEYLPKPTQGSIFSFSILNHRYQDQF